MDNAFSLCSREKREKAPRERFQKNAPRRDSPVVESYPQPYPQMWIRTLRKVFLSTKGKESYTGEERMVFSPMERKVLHIISHTDLDGVTAVAVAWHASFPEEAPLRVSLVGYGDVDALVLETLRAGLRPRVIDLFCQRQETVDHLDK